MRPGALYTGLTVALVVALAALAITAATTPPPAIAELSPSAVEQIKDAPQEQSSELGSADGGSASGDGIGAGTSTTVAAAAGGAATTTTTAKPVERARVRRCVGDPPRQTEDPQSPPCVPYFEGDNGGATYKGVTADTITLAIPEGSARVVTALETYFNKRYEFYGRRLVLKPGGGGENCTDRKASAVAADTQLGAFGGLDATNGNAGPCFQAEMARRQLMSAVVNVTFTEDDMGALDPYLWQYSMSFDRIAAAVGELFCSRLAKQNATYSRDPLIQTKPRKLGVLIQNVLRDTDLPLTGLERELAKCGETAVIERLSTNDDVGLVSPERAQAAMIRMRNANVTTVVNLGIAFVQQNISAAADSQQYFPEWIFTTYGGNDANLVVKTFWPQASQRQSIIGITVNPLQRPWEDEPGVWAFKEVDPTIDPVADVSLVQNFVGQYRTLLVVASGIQMAGPNLTPERFKAALQRTDFPYPEDDPTRSGVLDFSGDHSATEGFTEYWWSEAAPSPVGYVSDGAPGAFCYVDGGARRSLGRWPKGPAPFFTGPCDSGFRAG